MRRRASSAAQWVKLLAGCTLVAGLLLIWANVEVGWTVQQVEGWIEALGPVGPAVYAGVFMVMTVLMMPGAILGILGGALFGMVWGTVAAWLGATAGAGLVFGISRWLVRDSVEAWLRGTRRLTALDRAVGERGWKLVLLLRLSLLIPYNVQNYLYGVSAVRFWPCMLATAVGMLPGTVLCVYMGHMGRVTISEASVWAVTDAGWLGWMVLSLAGACAVAVVVVSTQSARAVLCDTGQQRAFESFEGPAGAPGAEEAKGRDAEADQG